MRRSQVYRILDANFNRTREGMRVCEEIARFVLESRPLSLDFKKARHAVTRCLNRLPVGAEELLRCRDAASDVGSAYDVLEAGRGEALNVFLANAERTKESLRVLEEFSKLVDGRLPASFKKIRFQIYELEKKVMPRLASLRHNGSGRGRF